MARVKKPKAEAIGQDLNKTIVEQLHPLVVDIGLLTIDPNNVREHDEPNLESVKNSLKRFRQRKPVVVRKSTMTIEAGNGTVTAAKQLGWSKIAAVVVEDDDVEAAAYAIADNRTAELANWDYSKLIEQFRELDIGGFDVSTLGWDQKELDMLLQSSTFKADPVEPLPGSLGKGDDANADGDGGSDPQIDKHSMKLMRVAYYKHQKKGETLGQFCVRAINAMVDDD